MVTKPANKNRRLLYILVGVVALLGIAAFLKSKQKPEGEKVFVEKVQKRTIRETVSASGKIFPETEVKLASDVSGEIVELTVKEGDSVSAGQILGKIRPDEYASAVERGEAALKSAESQKQISSSSVGGSSAQIEQMKADRMRTSAQLDAARATHTRNEQLLKEGVISQSDFDNSLSNKLALEAGLAAADANLKAAQASFKSAEENVRVSDYGISSARATLKELRTSLQKTLIVAPVNGIVSKLNVEKGERVVGTLQMAGTEMMRIANLHSMEVQVDVSENDILKVALKDEAEIEVDAYLGRKFKGYVTEIASSASNVGTSGASLNTDQVTNFIVKIRIDPASYADLIKKGSRYPFRPGMSASVDIFTNTAENILTVPIIAVTAREADGSKIKQAVEDEEKKDDDKMPEKEAAIVEIVFFVQGDTVGMREVKTGIQDNDYIEVTSGLQEGETVVVGPYSAIARKLKPGSAITVEDKNKAKKEDD